MKDNMLSFALLGFLLSWMLPADSMVITIDFNEPNVIPLNMVEEAVDDMYDGCTDKMMNMVKNTYMGKEKKDAMFKYVWKNAEKCAKTGQGVKRPWDGALKKEHFQAICVYTSEHDQFYTTFNTAVRTERNVYNTNFKFHSLHFLLTSAVQTLKKSQNYCAITYRRTKSIFTGDVNTVMRFGYFASSSFRTDLTHFGSKSCFEIWTCHGAYLKNYSEYEDELEVLIPPYEMFRITEITKGPQLKYHKGLGDCEVVFSLQSVGVHSNLNCTAKP